MWHAEKWYRGTYLESRNGNPDVENRRVDTGEWVVVEEECTGRQGSHTHPITGYHRQLVGSCWLAQRAQCGALWQPGGVERGRGRWERGPGERGCMYRICTHRADSLHYTAENNTITLQLKKKIHWLWFKIQHDIKSFFL